MKGDDGAIFIFLFKEKQKRGEVSSELIHCVS